MARSDIYTLIPLDFWASVYGIDPYRFNQVNVADEENECDPLWCQYPPGYGAEGRFHLRDLLAQALKQAEERMAEYLGSPVAPDWVMDEVPWPSGNTGLVQTERFRVIEFGQPQWTYVGTYPVAYAGNWGYVNVPHAAYAGDPCELVILSTPPDNYGYPSDVAACLRPTYQVRPLRRAYYDGTLLMTVLQAHKAQFVDPVLWETCVALDPDDAATYQTNVQVWRVSLGAGASYPAAEIVFTCPSCSDMCEETEELSCAAVSGALDKRGGKGRAYVWPAEYVGGHWVAKCPPNCSCPVRVRLHYHTGVRPDTVTCCEPYERTMATAVARLATAYLPHSPCGCEAVAQMFEDDRRWMAASGDPMSSPADPHAYMNPFGNTWAAQNALRVCRLIRPNAVTFGGKS